MTKTERNYVETIIDNEGFDYAFRHYTDFSKVTDETFHELRKAYVAAAKKLADYIGVE